MKRRRNFRFFILLLVMVFGISPLRAETASAHEMYYDGNTPIVLKWNDVTNRTAKLKMNGDKLHGGYVSLYTSIRSVWPNASSRVSVTQTSFSSSNVDLATATEAAWEDRWGNNCREYLGICDISSTDGYQLTNAANAKSSSKRIRYAGILYTPYESDYADTTNKKRTMVHEIGHALGLGHPNVYAGSGGSFFSSDPSVMRSSGYETYFTPQTHDKTDLNNKY